MIVSALRCGTVAFHATGDMVQAKTVTVDILAQNVPGPDGLGAFEVHLTFPPETQFIKAVNDTTWLTSTGRTDPWCDSPALIDGTWVFRCSTLRRHPKRTHRHRRRRARHRLAASVSGRLTVISLAGSQLADIAGRRPQCHPGGHQNQHHRLP